MIAAALLAAYLATPANLPALIAKARTEPDVHITMGCGAYGDVLVKYAPVSLDGPACAVLNVLTLQGGASGSTLSGFSAQGVRLAGISTWPVNDVAILGLKIKCPTATTGWDPSIPPPVGWKGGDVIGYPTGGGVSATLFSNLTVQGNEVWNCDKGVGFATGQHLKIVANHIHDVRTSPIVGASLSDVLVERNWLATSNPFNPNNDGNGDHSDFIHFWTVKGKGSFDSLTIHGNLIDQGSGTAILGIHLDDQKTGLGFTHLNVDSNVIILANTQAIRIENGHGAISNNRMFQPGPGKSPQVVICTNPLYCAPSTVTLSGNVTAPGITSPQVLDQLRAAFGGNP
jgi:hypothetical protein